MHRKLILNSLVRCCTRMNDLNCRGRDRREIGKENLSKNQSLIWQLILRVAGCLRECAIYLIVLLQRISHLASGGAKCVLGGTIKRQLSKEQPSVRNRPTNWSELSCYQTTSLLTGPVLEGRMERMQRNPFDPSTVGQLLKRTAKWSLCLGYYVELRFSFDGGQRCWIDVSYILIGKFHSARRDIWPTTFYSISLQQTVVQSPFGFGVSQVRFNEEERKKEQVPRRTVMSACDKSLLLVKNELIYISGRYNETCLFGLFKKCSLHEFWGWKCRFLGSF